MNAILAEIIIIAVLSGSGLSRAAVAEPCHSVDRQVERAIAARVRTLNGKEYCEYRIYSPTTDLDGDARPDVVLTFNVEGVGGGGNNVHSFLLVHLSNAPAGTAPLLVEVGERGHFLPDSIETGMHSQIIVNTVVWTRTDPMCCPTGKGRLVFSVGHNRLERRGG